MNFKRFCDLIINEVQSKEVLNSSDVVEIGKKCGILNEEGAKNYDVDCYQTAENDLINCLIYKSDLVTRKWCGYTISHFYILFDKSRVSPAIIYDSDIDVYHINDRYYTSNALSPFVRKVRSNKVVRSDREFVEKLCDEIHTEHRSQLKLSKSK